MTGVAREIVIDLVTGAAAFQLPSPFCATVMLHSPTSFARTTPRTALSTTHAPLASKATGSAELADAMIDLASP